MSRPKTPPKPSPAAEMAELLAATDPESAAKLAEHARPKVLMLDELSLGLAPRLVLDLFDALRRLKAEGLTMLLVEQNVAMAMAVSNYAYVLAEGRVHLEGEARELAKKEEVRRAYLGL